MFPVFKKGDKSDICNYRGISMLCACSKLFEKVMFRHMSYAFLPVISVMQHGFMPKRSIETNLLHLLQFCYSNIDKGLQVDVIYTDFSAAFDKDKGAC